MSAAIVVWRFTDGKHGHENQSAGLLAALQQRVPVEDFLFHTADCRRGMLECIRGHDPYGLDKPDPDLIIGAGHATHLPMLNARRMRGGKVIALMKPTLPNGWFDLCMVPAHDRPRHADNILVTQGVLNRVQPGSAHDPRRGLILVGGPSAHVNWQDESVLAAVREIVTHHPEIHWQLATSRRTPDSFGRALGHQPQENLDIVPVSATAPEWLPVQLAQAARVWVTSDSVSMVYEALTSGAAVGLIDVPYRKAGDRLARGIEDLVRRGQVVRLTDWRAGRELQPPAQPFNEAARCADWIVDQWLQG